MGFVGPLLIVFSLPLMIDIVDNEFSHLSDKRKSQAYDFSGGLFNSFLYFGQILGPIYATNMTQIVGFRRCTEDAAFGSLALFLLYLFFTKSIRKPI